MPTKKQPRIAVLLPCFNEEMSVGATVVGFRKALPILKDGEYLAEKDIPAARSLLRAAAFTYLASALATLIDLARWVRLLR